MTLWVRHEYSVNVMSLQQLNHFPQGGKLCAGDEADWSIWIDTNRSRDELKKRPFKEIERISLHSTQITDAQVFNESKFVIHDSQTRYTFLDQIFQKFTQRCIHSECLRWMNNAKFGD